MSFEQYYYVMGNQAAMEKPSHYFVHTICFVLFIAAAAASINQFDTEHE